MPIDTSTTSVLLFKGGPTLIDMMIDVPEIRVRVTGPRMLFDRLELLTTASVLDGCSVQTLTDLARCLKGTVHSGLSGIQSAQIGVRTSRAGGVIEINVGPFSLYQSELLLKTRTCETFRALFERLFLRGQPGACIVGLHPVPATGHIESHHESSPVDSPMSHDSDSCAERPAWTFARAL